MSRGRLLSIIQHDVRRLDRLISDISDASRLDAELQRQESAPVDLAKLLNTLVTVANEVWSISPCYEKIAIPYLVLADRFDRIRQLLILCREEFTPLDCT